MVICARALAARSETARRHTTSRITGRLVDVRATSVKAEPRRESRRRRPTPTRAVDAHYLERRCQSAGNHPRYVRNRTSRRLMQAHRHPRATPRRRSTCPVWRVVDDPVGSQDLARDRRRPHHLRFTDVRRRLTADNEICCRRTDPVIPRRDPERCRRSVSWVVCRIPAPFSRHSWCCTMFRTLPSGARTKKRRTPQDSVHSGCTIS